MEAIVFRRNLLKYLDFFLVDMANQFVLDYTQIQKVCVSFLIQNRTVNPYSPYSLNAVVIGINAYETGMKHWPQFYSDLEFMKETLALRPYGYTVFYAV